MLDEAVDAGTTAVRLGGDDEAFFGELAGRPGPPVRTGRRARGGVRDSFLRTLGRRPDRRLETGGLRWPRFRTATARLGRGSNLSDVLRLRFEAFGAEEDLSESVELGRTALELADDGGAAVPDRPYPPSACAVNLGAALLARLFDGGPAYDADEVIRICRPIAADNRLRSRTGNGCFHTSSGRCRNERAAIRRTAARADLDDAVTVAHQLVAEPAQPIAVSHWRTWRTASSFGPGTTTTTASRPRSSTARKRFGAPLRYSGRARVAGTHATALTRRWQITRVDRDAAAALEQWLAVVRSPAVAATVRVAAARDAAALAHRWGRP